jgi:hypothetical protein
MGRVPEDSGVHICLRALDTAWHLALISYKREAKQCFGQAICPRAKTIDNPPWRLLPVARGLQLEEFRIAAGP